MSYASVPDRADVRANWLLILALLLTALAYIATVNFTFVYDDNPQIVLNQSITTWKTIPSLFLVHSWSFLLPDWAGNYYRPVFMSWVVVNRMLFGLNPAYWHATSLLLHLIATWLAFVVARQLFHDSVKAGMVALFFGLHPVHIESVAWVSGVTDPLLAVFTLAAMWAWIRGEHSPERQLPWKLFAVLLYAAACLSKETAVFLPLVIIAYDVLFGREERTWSGVLHSTVRTWPLWLTAGLYMVARSIVLRGLLHPYPTPVSQELLTIPTILWGYMRRLAWPLNLSVFYDTPPVTSPLQWRFWLPMLAWVFAIVPVWRIAKRSRIVAFSLLWIFVFLLPAILGLPVFPVGEWIHDRYLYLPSFGFCLLLVQAITQLPSKKELFGMPATPLTAALLIATAMAFGTAWQEQHWRNGFLLFVHSVKEAPNNALAKVHLANELFRVGKPQPARELYDEAMRLDPDNWKNNLSFGLFLFYTGDNEACAQRLQRTIKLDPEDPNPHFYLGRCLSNLGDYSGAERAFKDAMQRRPGWVRYHFFLGYALEMQGRIEEARKEYQEELRSNPRTDTPAEERLKSLPINHLPKN